MPTASVPQAMVRYNPTTTAAATSRSVESQDQDMEPAVTTACQAAPVSEGPIFAGVLGSGQ